MDWVRRYLPALPGHGRDQVKYAPLGHSGENGEAECVRSIWSDKRLRVGLGMLVLLVTAMGMPLATKCVYPHLTDDIKVTS